MRARGRRGGGGVPHPARRARSPASGWPCGCSSGSAGPTSRSSTPAPTATGWPPATSRSPSAAPLRTLLTAERTALNLLGQLSGVATATAAWVDAVEGTRARIRDTRKTVPGLRALQKYAVRCGGGVNHRMSLGDAVLIKDNHVAAAGSVTAALAAARAAAPDLPCEVEVDSFAQLDEVLGLGVELVLLDNFTPAQSAAGRRPPRRPRAGHRASRSPAA